MEWLTILGVTLGMMVGNAALFLPIFFWMRTEANADRRDIVNLIVAIKDDARAFSEKMATESREFHGRLCAIEERKGKQ